MIPKPTPADCATCLRIITQRIDDEGRLFADEHDKLLAAAGMLEWMARNRTALRSLAVHLQKREDGDLSDAECADLLCHPAVEALAREFPDGNIAAIRPLKPIPAPEISTDEVIP